MTLSQAFKWGKEDAENGEICFPEAVFNCFNRDEYRRGYASVAPDNCRVQGLANQGKRMFAAGIVNESGQAVFFQDFDPEYDSHEEIPGMAEAQPSI